MAWNNVVPPNDVLNYHLGKHASELDNPLVSIPNELVTDCLIRYEFEGLYSIISNADHPAFAEVRRLLAGNGFIKIPEYACWNGDRVTKRFRFNGVQLEVGDTFYSAAAWSVKLNH